MKIKDKWFYFPIIILSVYLIIRLINQYQSVTQFPLDWTNDLVSYITLLFFLTKVGYHGFVPYWYNGFTLFNFTPPAWYYFTLPLTYLTNVSLATYISRIIIYVLGFITIWVLGIKTQISKIKRIAFFLFFFANAIAIGNFIRLGRVPELFALLILIMISSLFLYYKDKPLNKYFILFIPLYAILILAHQSIALVFHIPLLSFFLIKPKKEKYIIILSVILALLLVSFWLLPYLSSFFTTWGASEVRTIDLITFDKMHLPQNIASTLIPLFFLIIFYLYYKQNKSKKEFLFYLPLIITSILIITRLIYLTPLFKYAFPDSYLHLLIFFSLFLFLKTKFSKKITTLAILSLFLISILSVSINHFHTPYFTPHTDLDKETLSIFPLVQGKYILAGPPPSKLHKWSYHSLTPIYYNLSTPSGWSMQVTSQEYIDYLTETELYLETSLPKEKCDDFITRLKTLNTTSVITYDQHCNDLKQCNLKEITTKKHVCLYTL
ncbi:hypothetical protein CL618_00040 [archaeon]|nr:hypothetical protein [archaeon]